MIFQEDFEQMRSLEQDLTFLSAKTEFDESGIPFKKNKVNFKIEMNLPVHYSNKCTKYILISILEIKNILVFQD